MALDLARSSQSFLLSLYQIFTSMVPTVTPNLQQKATSQVNYESVDTPKSIQTLLCTHLKYRALAKKQRQNVS